VREKSSRALRARILIEGERGNHDYGSGRGTLSGEKITKGSEKYKLGERNEKKARTKARFESWEKSKELRSTLNSLSCLGVWTQGHGE